MDRDRNNDRNYPQNRKRGFGHNNYQKQQYGRNYNRSDEQDRFQSRDSRDRSYRNIEDKNRRHEHHHNRDRSRSPLDHDRKNQNFDKEKHKEKSESSSSTSKKFPPQKNNEKVSDKDSSSSSDDDSEVSAAVSNPNLLIANISTPASTTLVDQVEKRKMLFKKMASSVPEEPKASATSSIWEKTSFSDDSDGKVSAKFKRLMGIKDQGGKGPEEGPKEKGGVVGTPSSQTQEYYKKLERQYEVARTITHTQRGLGLGFASSSSSSLHPPHSSITPQINTHKRFD